jgi:hypothetical protein
MSIVKNTPHILKHCRSGWTNLQNKTIDAVKDPATLGIYVYLASKPEDWTISETNLQRRFGKGRDFIRARLSELKHIGLLKTHAIKDEKGRVTRWETVLYNEIQNTAFQEGGSNVQITENPHSGKTSDLENPPTTKERDLKKKDINDHTHSVECDLFLEAEQQRKALMLRAKTVKHEKCRELYEQLPQEVKQEKTFEDVHDECVTHYATQTEPQMVSPQRLISWIKRDIKYHTAQASQPAKHQKSGDSFNQYMNSQKQQRSSTYDQHGNTYDPLR